jgi:5,6,7,8-tetrahydromethanopterin hydro-lyase
VPDNAHVNVLLGPSDGPVGTAFAAALSSPSLGHVPFLAVLAPNVAVTPPTLFVNKVDIRDELHARLTWGAAQAGIARGVLGAAQRGLLPDGSAEGWLVIAAVWVNPQARDEQAIFESNRIAVGEAIARAVRGGPTLAEQMEAARDPWNPFFGARE